MRRWARYSGLIALVGASLVACASSSDKGVTKAEFLREANANCTRTDKDAVAVRREFKAASTPALQAKLLLEKVLPRFNRQLDEIAKLEPPKADRARVKVIIELARRESKDFANVLEADPVAALPLRTQLFTRSSSAAKEYGLKICVY
jgi:outer membrane murein-binding lipoprotein Lpp